MVGPEAEAEVRVGGDGELECEIDGERVVEISVVRLGRWGSGDSVEDVLERRY